MGAENIQTIRRATPLRENVPRTISRAELGAARGVFRAMSHLRLKSFSEPPNLRLERLVARIMPQDVMNKLFEETDTAYTGMRESFGITGIEPHRFGQNKLMDVVNLKYNFRLLREYPEMYRGLDAAAMDRIRARWQSFLKTGHMDLHLGS